jgi:hypothetical protein
LEFRLQPVFRLKAGLQLTTDDGRRVMWPRIRIVRIASTRRPGRALQTKVPAGVGKKRPAPAILLVQPRKKPWAGRTIVIRPPTGTQGIARPALVVAGRGRRGKAVIVWFRPPTPPPPHSVPPFVFLYLAAAYPNLVNLTMAQQNQPNLAMQLPDKVSLAMSRQSTVYLEMATPPTVNLAMEYPNQLSFSMGYRA